MQWALQYAQRGRNIYDKVFYIGSPDPAKFKRDDLPKQIRSLNKLAKNKIVFVFIGTFSNYYNPTIIAKAARLFKNRDDILFLVAGGGNNQDNFEKETKMLNNLKISKIPTKYEIY